MIFQPGLEGGRAGGAGRTVPSSAQARDLCCWDLRRRSGLENEVLERQCAREGAAPPETPQPLAPLQRTAGVTLPRLGASRPATCGARSRRSPQSPCVPSPPLFGSGGHGEHLERVEE